MDATRHHRLKAWAAYGFDMVQIKDGVMFKNNPSKLENFYAWSQPIVAQADGIVTAARDDKPDNVPGQIGGYDDANYVSIDYGGGIVGFYAHLQKGSLKVAANDPVKAGQTLALVGCSGAAGFPHLHFSMSDHATFSVRGRYRVEVQRVKGWELVDGQDLKEGSVVRNPAAGEH